MKSHSSQGLFEGSFFRLSREPHSQSSCDELSRDSILSYSFECNRHYLEGSVAPCSWRAQQAHQITVRGANPLLTSVTTKQTIEGCVARRKNAEMSTELVCIEQEGDRATAAEATEVGCPRRMVTEQPVVHDVCATREHSVCVVAWSLVRSSTSFTL